MAKCKITVAGNMSEETCSELISGVKNKFGITDEIDCVSDCDLIGGFVVNIDGYIYDYSIKTQLDSIKKHLQSDN